MGLVLYVFMRLDNKNGYHYELKNHKSNLIIFLRSFPLRHVATHI